MTMRELRVSEGFGLLISDESTDLGALRKEITSRGWKRITAQELLTRLDEALLRTPLSDPDVKAFVIVWGVIDHAQTQERGLSYSIRQPEEAAWLNVRDWEWFTTHARGNAFASGCVFPCLVN